jgi:hypothetical protein
MYMYLTTVIRTLGSTPPPSACQPAGLKPFTRASEGLKSKEGNREKEREREARWQMAEGSGGHDPSDEETGRHIHIHIHIHISGV